jgi:hypothetical protein
VHASAPASSLRALVAGLVDYAGLFPPAALAMPDAVAAYAGYLKAPESWMLGRFVVPVARLGELATDASRWFGAGSEPWRLAALPGDDLADGVQRLVAFNETHAGRALVDVVELRASTPDAIVHAARAVDSAFTLYMEVPVASDPRALLRAVHDAGARAKVRTGGLTADAFPSAEQLARFIVACAELALPFKATAGLHHPLRAEHRLTYEHDAPHGTMFGFLNVFAASAFARAGMAEPAVARLLEERDATALTFADDGLRWREHMISSDELSATRQSFAIAFGSCSFREPVDDLHQLRLL